MGFAENGAPTASCILWGVNAMPPGRGRLCGLLARALLRGLAELVTELAREHRQRVGLEGRGGPRKRLRLEKSGGKR
eukprot:5067348-Pyramimonas_sp.AAC.1